jgi:hypothetical protein
LGRPRLGTRERRILLAGPPHRRDHGRTRRGSIQDHPNRSHGLRAFRFFQQTVREVTSSTSLPNLKARLE